MKALENENTESLEQLISRYFKTIKPTNDKTDSYSAKIIVSGYLELSYIISSMLKICIVALDQDTISNSEKDSAIDIALLLKVVSQLLPLEEIEFLDEINKIFINESQYTAKSQM